VLVVDNNTPDEATWQPLAEACRKFGFKCLHLDQWPGYKSGALNFALSMTDPRAEIVGVIDADYIVEPDFLRRSVPYFEDPNLAFVQAPQDYREQQTNRFTQAAYDGYKYFFALSMPARNERNAIIFCGTMGLLRKRVLQEIGGWDEWCITEDAELSLRILNRGYKAQFLPATFGRGLMPLDFEGLKKQRFRWAFGGVQILKKHWGKLMPWARWVDPDNRLTLAQRYFYLVSGLQWFNELLTFGFTLMVLISAFLTITGHVEFLRPTAEAFVILPIVLIGSNILRAAWGLRHALGLSWGRAFRALTGWFSLTWVVALACVQALVRERGVFLRTPKAISNAAWARALQATHMELLFGGACLVAGLLTVISQPSWLALGLLGLCLSQAAIYLSAPWHSLMSVQTRAARPVDEPDRGNIRGSFANESRLGVQAAVLALVALVIVFAASFWPSRQAAPWWYGYVNPDPLLTPAPVASATARALTPSPIPSATPIGTVASPTPGSILATLIPPQVATLIAPQPTDTPAPTSAPPGDTPPPEATSPPASSATSPPAASATSAPVASATSAPAATATTAPTTAATTGAGSTAAP
jgi:hypothetical protein